MPKYTDKDRRKSIATRKRNAQIRKEERARLGYNPNNPLVKLTENLVVTKEVEKKLNNQSEKSTKLSILEIILIVISAFFVIICFAARPFTIMNLTFFVPSAIATIIFAIIHGKKVKTRTNQLALERQERIEERKQFYSSPEWRQVRTQVTKEYGELCSECGLYIRESIDVTVDHIRPRSKYPTLALNKTNLRVLCRRCNSKKGDRDSEIYANEQL